MRGLVAAMAVAGCYSPSPPPGAPCTSSETCPEGLFCSPATNTCERDEVPAGDAMIDTPDDAMVDAMIDAPASPYAYRRSITINNTSTATLPVGFTIRVPLTTTLPLLIAGQKVRLDYRDLHVITDLGAGGQVHRIVDPVSAPAPAAVSFALVQPIAPGGTSTNYWLYYGDPTMPADPLNTGSMVFPIYDGFSSGIASFWNVNSAPTAVGGNLVLRAGQVDALSTTAASDNLPIVSAIELLARAVNPQSDPTVQTDGTFWYWFGYQRTGDFVATDPWSVWIARDKGIMHGEQSSPGGCEAGCGGPNVATNSNFVYYAIERDATATRFYRNGTLSYTATVTNTTDYSVILRNFMATSNVEVDYVRARARVSPDPTVMVGAEENL